MVKDSDVLHIVDLTGEYSESPRDDSVIDLATDDSIFLVG